MKVWMATKHKGSGKAKFNDTHQNHNTGMKGHHGKEQENMQDV